MITFGIVAAFVFGAIIGSFLNVLILRLPKGQAITGRSHCMHCQHELGVFDLIPLFSYIFLFGRCRYCHVKISPRYIIIELITALLFVWNYLVFISGSIAGLSALLLLRNDFIAAALIVVFTVDYEEQLILDKFIAPATIILLLFNIAVDLALKNPMAGSLTLLGLLSAAGLFLFFGTIYLFSSGKWIGFGDVKFSFFLGLATPFPMILLTVFGAYLIGAIFGIALLLARLKNFSSKIAFGTFLSVSCIITLNYGAVILNWYLQLLGLK